MPREAMRRRAAAECALPLLHASAAVCALRYPEHLAQ
jgi:hypothetical protein